METCPILTSTECYHGTPDEAHRKLSSGVLYGCVFEGTPDERKVRIELRGGKGKFEPHPQWRDEDEDEDEEQDEGKGDGKEEEDAPPTQTRVGFYPWWWWWYAPDYYYWDPYWDPYTPYIYVYGKSGDDGDNGTPIEGHVRVCIRAHKDGDHKDGDHHYEMCDITVQSKSMKKGARVTSCTLECAVPKQQSLNTQMLEAFVRGCEMSCCSSDEHVGSNIPRILPRRKTKPKKPDDVKPQPGRPEAQTKIWRAMIPIGGKKHATKITVEEEDPKQHPWTGLGGRGKYALQEAPRSDKKKRTRPRQGVHLALAAGLDYYFDGSKIPEDHPFHFTLSPTGAESPSEHARLSLPLPPKTITRKSKEKYLVYTPSPSIIGAFAHYYQCTQHEMMGGYVTIYKLGNPPRIVMTDPKVVVAQSIDTGTFSIMYGPDGGGKIVEASTLSDVMETLGLAAHPKFRLAESVATQQLPETLVFAQIGYKDGECDVDDEDAPAIIMHADGKEHCNHIHTTGTLRTWLTEGEAKDVDNLCPSCAVRGRKGKTSF